MGDCAEDLVARGRCALRGLVEARVLDGERNQLGDRFGHAHAVRVRRPLPVGLQE